MLTAVVAACLVAGPVPAGGWTGAPASPAAAAQPAPSYQNPAVSGLTANPFVLHSDGTYYAYVSGIDPFGVPMPVYALSSTDLQTWDPVGSVLPPANAGAWTDTSFGARFSSPSVLELPDNPAAERFVLYFTGTHATTDNKCIGVATASSPTGPFTGAPNPLICPPGGAQDPSPVTEWTGFGFQQLVYRHNGTNPGIHNQVLTADGQSLNPNHPNPYPLDAALPSWWQGHVDRPGVVIEDGEVYLFFSGGTPNTAGRAVGWSRCNADWLLIDTCTDQPRFGTWMSGTTAVDSPGSAQPFRDAAGHMWMAYDGLPGGSCTATGCSGVRNMRIDKLCIVGAGTGEPRTNGPTTTSQPLARPASGDCSEDVPQGWAASWASAGFLGNPLSSEAPYESYTDGFADQTLRQVAHTSLGGSAVRVRVRNASTTGTLQVGAATVAVADEPSGSSASVQPASLRSVTFGGATGIAVPPETTVVSDPVALAVPGDHDVAVSVYLPQPTGTPTAHHWGGETSHVGPGNLVGSTGAGFTDAPTYSSFYVTGLDVLHPDPAGSVVVLGDSLSDGILTVPRDSEHRWSDVLYDRLAAASVDDTGVVNVASAGNTLLPADGNPDSGLGRFERDVLAQSGVATVVVLLGTNDLGAGRTGQQIADGLRTLVDRAHARGVRVVGATIPPVVGPCVPAPPPPPASTWCVKQAGCPPDPPPCPPPPPFPSATEAERQTANAQIRPGSGSVGFDAVVDIDAVLRDPADHRRVHATYAFVDNFHPNEAGHDAMAQALDLGSLVP